jgi:hypothetical protein
MMADSKPGEISEGQIEEAEQDAADPSHEKILRKGKTARVGIQRSINNPAPKPGLPMLEQLISD